jgi:hypothetical protein
MATTHVGDDSHVALPWIHRVFSLMKRWSLDTYHGCAQSTSTPISTNSSFAEVAALIGGLAAHYEPMNYWDIVNERTPVRAHKSWPRVKITPVTQLGQHI